MYQHIQSRQPRWLLALFLLVISAVMMQDYLRTLINGTAYFWNESLLFASFWGMFVPGSLLLRNALTREGLLNISLRLKSPLLAFSVSVLHFLLTPMLIWLLSFLFFDHTYEYAGVSGYLIGEYLYLVLPVYIVLALLPGPAGKRTVVEDQPVLSSSPHPLFADRLLVNQGRTNIVIETASIFYICAATPYVAIHLENKKLLYNEKLKTIGETLDDHLFVRIHRSCIVNISKVVCFRSRLNGDYDLELQNGESVRLSRNYWPVFKEKFGKRHQPGV